MADVTLYSTGWCPFCVRAKRLLAGKDARVHEIDVDREPEARREMTVSYTHLTLPTNREV